MGNPEFELLHRIPSGSNNYYRVLQRLGEGGNSHVYLVEAITGPNKGVLFALKIFIRVQDATRLGRFAREVDFLIECDHPAVMKVYDKGESVHSEGGQVTSFPFVVAEYLPRTLYDAMRSGLNMIEKLTFTLQLLSGISYLCTKTAPIIHRDIKPENVFVRGKSCILGDFGLMKVLTDNDEDDKDYAIESIGPRLPRFYRSPDLVNYCRGKSDLTIKADVFQLGLVLAEMFTGKCPLKAAKNIYDEVELDPLLPIGGSQGAAISAQLERMLELSTEKRPFAHDLIDVWEGIFLEAVKVSFQLEGRAF